MTLQELKQLYEGHNVALPHDSEKCDICQRWEHRFDDPYRNLNGNGF